MKKNVVSILIVMIAVIVLLFLLSKKYFPVVHIPMQTSYQVEQTHCYDDDKYFIVHQPVVNATGSNILVKYKKSTTENFVCSYAIGEGDFELRNPTGADYFLAIIDRFLVIDSGTAASNRGITLYDLDSRQEVFHDQYYGDPLIKESSISYWVIAENNPYSVCPDKGYEGSGVLLEYVIFNLESLTKESLHETRCS